MEIALERIRNCVNGVVDLRRLNLTELPPIPEGIIELNCSHNQLTSLPRLPSTLEMFNCSYNQLTSLPALPPSIAFPRLKHCKPLTMAFVVAIAGTIAPAIDSISHRDIIGM